MSQGLYAYAVVGAGRDPLPPVEGVAPGRLRLVVAEPVAAVVTPVEIAAFEGEALEENLACSGWLKGTVQGHDRVVRALMDGGPVLPMRFGSIFSDESALRSMLEANRPALADLLARLTGRVEFGVTIWADRTTPVPAAPRPASGRDYLRARSAELAATGEADQAQAVMVEAIHAALSEESEESSLLRSRRADPAVLLTAAYLVPTDAVEHFCQQVDRTRRSHSGRCRLELTGPWPPYSFVSLDVAGPGA